jgi:predicted aspartyl protease
MGTRGRESTVEGILHTGFDRFLCLPTPIAVPLGLELIDATDMELADGTIVDDELSLQNRQTGMEG